MSATVVAGTTLVTQFICTYNGQVSVSNRYWKVGIVAGIITYDDVALDVGTTMAPLFKALLATPATYYGVAVRQISPANLNRWSYGSAGRGVGSAGSTPLPTQSCGLVHFNGSVIGKHGSGRTYLPFPATADQSTDATPSAGYLTRATAWALPLQTSRTVAPGGGATAQLDPVLIDLRTGTTSYIVDSVVRDAWATQKRRGAFGRLNLLPW